VEVPAAEIETTQEEIDAFNIIRAIARQAVDVHRVGMRDAKTYCAILLDDNNRKTICRLHFGGKQKYLGLFTAKQEERVPISDLTDIFNFGDRIRATIAEYDGSKV
jgi:hypothetical protein